ncbi:MAG: hypothetical protein U0794_05335 [Isosphaeraceae bacterium]
MIERLALPEWDTPRTSLESWVQAIQSQGYSAEVERESTGVSWLNLGRLMARGYAVMQGKDVEAINFELAAPDPTPALQLLERVAAQLGWALHDESDEPDEEDE